MAYESKKPESESNKKELDLRMRAKRWQGRIADSEKVLSGWKQTGRECKKFVLGDQWDEGAAKVASLGDYCRTTANRMKGLVRGMQSSIAFNAPNVVAKPIRAGQVARRRAEINQAYEAYCLRKTRFVEHQQLCAYDAIIYGAGFLEKGLDKERKDDGVVRARWISAEDIVIDPHADTVMESCSWVGYKFAMRRNDARREFGVDDLESDEDYATKKQSSRSEDRGKSSGDPGDARVTLYKIFSRADSTNPVIPDANLDDPDNKVPVGDAPADEPEFDKYLRKSGNRCFVISMHYHKPLYDEPVHFVINHGKLPIEVIKADMEPGEILPNSLLKAVLPLQKAINMAMTFLLTQARTSSQEIFAIPRDQKDPNMQATLKGQEPASFGADDRGPVPGCPPGSAPRP
jgi:hypothetical protein